MAKRIYLVEEATEGDSVEHLISASSQSAAIQFLVKGRYKAGIPTTREVADLVSEGVKVQEA